MLSITILLLEFALLFVTKDTNGSQSSALVGILILFFSVGFIFDVNRSQKLSPYTAPLLAGYFWRLFLVFFDLYGKGIYNLPNSGYDSEMFFDASVSFISTGDPGRGEAFSKVMGRIFSIVGTSRLYGQFLVMLFSVVSLCMLVHMLVELEISYNNSYRAVRIVALLPNFAILSSIFLRESIVTMFLSISLVCFVKWLSRKNELWFFAAFCFAFVSALFHSGSAAVAIGYIAVRLLYDKKSRKIRLALANIVPSLFFIVVIAYLYINHADVLFGKMSNITSVSDVAATSNEGGSSYAAYVGNSNSLVSMAVYTIPRVVYFMFSPFPWQWRSLSDIIAFVFSSLFYFIAVKNAIQCLRLSEDRNRKTVVLVFLLIAVCVVFVFAWGVSNTGTATRHRDKMIILFGLIYAIGHSVRGRQQAQATRAY